MVTGSTGSPGRWIPGSLGRWVTKCDRVPCLRGGVTIPRDSDVFGGTSIEDRARLDDGCRMDRVVGPQLGVDGQCRQTHLGKLLADVTFCHAHRLHRSHPPRTRTSRLRPRLARCCLPAGTQTVYWILAASKGWIKQTYRKIMHAQNTL